MAVSSKRRVVVDASFVLSFLMPDEVDSKTDQLFDQYKSGEVIFISSPLIYFEVLNALKSAYLKKRIDINYARSRMDEFLNYQIELVELDFSEIFNLSIKYDLTVYDASYLYISKLEQLELLTLDKDLQRC